MSEIHAETVGYTRNTMLPPQPPPQRQSGAILWLRENLLSGPLNILLTILGIAVVWYLVSGVWPWLANSVWRADGLQECRAIITARAGEGTTGACWAVIRERWWQFTFGFYPRALYWRPVAAFGLLFVAIAPILFADERRIRRVVLGVAAVLTLLAMWAVNAPDGWLVAVAAVMVGGLVLSERRPSALLAFSGFYPVLAYWLLWGGSLWQPLMVLAGFFVGWGIYRLVGRGAPILRMVAAVLAVVAWWLWLGPLVAQTLAAALPLAIAAVTSDTFGGFLLSITIGVTAISMSLPLGIILALARRSDLPLVKMLAVTFIEFIRGVPLIALLFVASLLLNYFLPPGTSFDIILRVIIMVTLFAAAYMAEVIRGGLAALPRGQYEAADALGLDYWKAQRLIILPQALKVSIPGIVGTFIGIFKDTTLVTFVGLYDPLKSTADSVRASIAWKGTYWEPYIFTGAIFFILCFAMSRYSMYLETRLKRGDSH
ncbi:ABC transporter permease subunit [Paracoccus sp. S-4012]|uniref:amino acid ABC transporter permease n=1 Tax=Paracoccus sp. S-4012 TaxID=2665648 RepID=UPI0012B05594|nr:amino acid ABC transporter permease [Paracoccus sp. S-4012]MRX51030.1 ABC transporter permease subunit [Paracoccus sp. S-4012]